MPYKPTQEDVLMLYQNNFELFVKIDLLDKNFKIIENIQGNLIDSDYNIDADSDIRRTMNLTLFVKDSSFLVGKNTNIWIDKYIEVFVGFTNQRNREIVYYSMGTYLFDEVGYKYDTTTKNLTLNCVDLMSNFTGLRNGQLSGLDTQIPEGSDIRQSIIDTLVDLGNYNKYRIDSRDITGGVRNYFDITNSNNIFTNCINSGIDLIIDIPIISTYASITYYNSSLLEPSKSYTFSFKTTDDISDSKIKIKLTGAKNNISSTQEIQSVKNVKLLTFTIDSDFEYIENIEIIFAELDTEPTETYHLDLQEIAIYSGVYTTSTLPKFVEYNRSVVVPYNLKLSTGSTIYDLLKQLNDLEAGWEMFFDIDKTFINQKIPTTEEDNYILDYSVFDKILISEDSTTNFSEVKNVTKVWGKTLDADRISDITTNEEEVYDITLDGILDSDGEISYGDTIAFKPNVNNIDNPELQVSDNTFDTSVTKVKYPIVDGNENPLAKDRLKANTYYVVKYRNEKFYLQGQFQVVYVVKEYNELPLLANQTKEQWIALDKAKEGTDNVKYIINSESELITPEMTKEEIKALYNPFAIDEIGEIRQTLSGGEFDVIYTDDLARQRAEYENWKAMRLTSSITLSVKNIFWLDVNQKIQYRSPLTNEIKEYIVKSLSGNIGSGITTINAVEFYPLYPFVVED